MGSQAGEGLASGRQSDRQGLDDRQVVRQAGRQGFGDRRVVRQAGVWRQVGRVKDGELVLAPAG